MRAVLTRVTEAFVEIDGEVVSGIGKGFLVLLGVKAGDSAREAEKTADRICGLRVFEDETGRMSIGPAEAEAEILIVSQFTLYGDVRQRRPGFTLSARPEAAEPLCELCAEECRRRGFSVKTGRFGADMQIRSVNDGPVTLIIDTDEL
ncbi:MAG: D-aminoacyl-tRNA deacylase [Oscillospiraceae bacterium]|nr:D-aminoacyl-tRNA deacylase [Oscillospiraceae bacterium]